MTASAASLLPGCAWSHPGTATEQDVIDVHDRTNRLCELVDGVLVEKVMGFDESRFSVLLATFLVAFLNRE